MGSEKLAATHGKMIKLNEKLKFPVQFANIIDHSEGLLIFSAENKQVLIHPIKEGQSVIKIWVALDELNASFQKELISDLKDYGLTDVWVAGIKSAEPTSTGLIYEGFFQTEQEIDIKHLKQNISNIGDVTEVKIEVIEKK